MDNHPPLPPRQWSDHANHTKPQTQTRARTAPPANKTLEPHTQTTHTHNHSEPQNGAKTYLAQVQGFLVVGSIRSHSLAPPPPPKEEGSLAWSVVVVGAPLAVVVAGGCCGATAELLLLMLLTPAELRDAATAPLTPDKMSWWFFRVSPVGDRRLSCHACSASRLARSGLQE